VLCLLFQELGETSVVLTRRAAHLRAHPGEVSFPGGRLHPEERPLQAALRETEEEIGLPGTEVEVIGRLSPLTTRRSSAIVHCFVGAFPGPGAGGRPWRVDPEEVERVFSVPLAALLADGVFHEELWPVPETPTGSAEPGAEPGTRPLAYQAVPFYALEDEVVWGVTGRLLTELLSEVMGRRDAGAAPDGSLGER
jgi:8-oxo-dGTP pyrophosphatase MutT (NUDIX family)